MSQKNLKYESCFNVTTLYLLNNLAKVQVDKHRWKDTTQAAPKLSTGVTTSDNQATISQD